MPNMVYVEQESLNATYGYNFNSGVTDRRNVQMNMFSLPAGSGRLSAVCDLGPNPRPALYQLRARMNWSAAVGSNTALADIYAVESNKHDVLPGNLASGDATINRTKCNNFGAPVMTLVADSPTNGEYQDALSDPFQIQQRYVALVAVNAHASTALDATDMCELTLLPFAWEIQ